MKMAVSVAGLVSTLAVAALGLSPGAANADAGDTFNWHLQGPAGSAKAEVPTDKAAASVASTEVTGSLGSSLKSEAAAPDGEKRVRTGRSLGYDGEDRGRYRDMIAKHAAANGIPFALADAVVRIESRYNPHVRHGGAVGLMQIKPQTARGLGYQGGAAGLLHPETNLKWGMLYLAQAYRMSRGDTCATVMRYQSGHGATRLSGANRVYCSKARTIMASLR